MHDVPSIPLTLAGVTASWLDDVLHEAGELNEAHIVDLDVKIVGVGTGFLGDVAVLYPKMAGNDGQALESMVVKMPTGNDNRRIGQTIGVYEREIRFYRELQSRLDIRTPRHIYSAMDASDDPEQTLKMLRLIDRLPLGLIRLALPLINRVRSLSTRRYALLIENLETCRIGDQVEGCSTEEAKRVLDTMARLHARFWGSEELDEFRWLLPIDLATRPFHTMYLQAVEQFKRAHQTWLRRRHVELLDWLKQHIFELTARMSTLPYTMIHCDFRLDNLCFDDDRGEVILFDWQTLARGPAGLDFAYFLSSAIRDPDQDTLNDLMEHYRQQLAANGVTMSQAELQWQYEAGLLAVVHRLVPAQFQDVLDLGAGRGKELIETWLERVFAKVEHMDPDRLL